MINLLPILWVKNDTLLLWFTFLWLLVWQNKFSYVYWSSIFLLLWVAHFFLGGIFFRVSCMISLCIKDNQSFISYMLQTVFRQVYLFPFSFIWGQILCRGILGVVVTNRISSQTKKYLQILELESISILIAQPPIRLFTKSRISFYNFLERWSSMICLNASSY